MERRKQLNRRLRLPCMLRLRNCLGNWANGILFLWHRCGLPNAWSYKTMNDVEREAIRFHNRMIPVPIEKVRADEAELKRLRKENADLRAKLAGRKEERK